MFEVNGHIFETEAQANAYAKTHGFVILEYFWDIVDGRYVADFEYAVDA